MDANPGVKVTDYDILATLIRQYDAFMEFFASNDNTSVDPNTLSKFVNQFATDKLRESTNSSIARAELEVNRINTNNIAQGNYIAEGYTNKNGTLTIVLQSQKADGSLENVATYDLGAKDIQNFRASAVVGADGYINFNAAGE